MRLSPFSLYQALILDLGHLIPLHPDDLCAERVQLQSPEEWWSPRMVAALSLLKSFLKKVKVKNSADADSAALSLFVENNERVRSYDFSEALNAASDSCKMALFEAKNLLHRWAHDGHGCSPFTASAVLAGFSVGPGAALGASGGSWYQKVSASRLTTTSLELLRMYDEYIAQPANSLWLESEIARREAFGSPVLVSASKLGFAPKYSHISRTICTEPSLNMSFQLGLSHVIESILRRETGIDIRGNVLSSFDDVFDNSLTCWTPDLHLYHEEKVLSKGVPPQQEKNRCLARLGSIGGDGFCTIDLSLASDSVSMSLAEALLPPDLMWWVRILRAQSTLLPDGKKVDLAMVSSMGNGFTFALETMVFTALVLGAYRSLGIPIQRPYGRNLGNFAVYGDDIIVVPEAFDLVVDVLKAAGFVVNATKSFSVGSSMRESCGADFWAGAFVRGVYLKSLESMQDRYSLFNRLVRWSTYTGLRISNTLSLLQKHVDRSYLVPFWDQDTAGLKVPSCVLHDQQFYGLRSSRVFASSRSQEPRQMNKPWYQGSYLYQRFAARKKELTWDGGQWLEGHTPSGIYPNPSGVLLASVKGSLFDGRILMRMERVRYDARTAVAPGWDGTRWSPPFYDGGDWWAAWKIAAECGLLSAN